MKIGNNLANIVNSELRNNPKASIYFYHKGVTDPDYCVLKFTAQEG